MDDSIQAPELSVDAKAAQPPVQGEPGADADKNFLDLVRNANQQRAEGDADNNDQKGGDLNAKSTDGRPSLPRPDGREEKEDLEKENKREEEEIEDDEPSDSLDDSEDGEPDITEDPLQDQPKPKKTKKENIKNLRESLKAARSEKEALAAKVAEYEAKYENIEQDEKVKQILEQKEARIKELEKYEDLLGLYKTDGFKEAYYDSIDNLKAEAVAIANDYGVDPEVVDNALKISSRKELNEYLLQYFDQIGVTDIRKPLLEAQAIAVDRHKAEQNPKKAREELVEIMKRTRAQNAEKVREKLKTRMESSWNSMLAVYSDSDAGIDVLKDKLSTGEVNANKAQILERAQTEYSKMMGVLVAAGVQDMPENVVKALAARFQLSEVTGHLNAKNQQLEAEVKELRKELDRQGKYSRPMSKGSGNGKTQSVSREIPTEKVAAHVMTRALQATAE